MRTMLVVVIAALFLTGCNTEPTVFGVPQSQWNTLTPSQKQQVIKGYNEQQRIAAENAPLDDAISAAQSMVNNRQN